MVLYDSPMFSFSRLYRHFGKSLDNGRTCVVGFVQGSPSSEVFGSSQACSLQCLLVSYRGPQGDRTLRHKYSQWMVATRGFCTFFCRADYLWVSLKAGGTGGTGGSQICKSRRYPVNKPILVTSKLPTAFTDFGSLPPAFTDLVTSSTSGTSCFYTYPLFIFQGVPLRVWWVQNGSVKITDLECFIDTAEPPFSRYITDSSKLKLCLECCPSILHYLKHGTVKEWILHVHIVCKLMKKVNEKETQQLAKSLQMLYGLTFL